MIGNEQLIECFLCYGRAAVQDFVIRSRSIQDSIDYIRMEGNYEFLRLTSFVTKDLRTFKRRKNNPWWIPIDSKGPAAAGPTLKAGSRE